MNQLDSSPYRTWPFGNQQVFLFWIWMMPWIWIGPAGGRSGADIAIFCAMLACMLALLWIQLRPLHGKGLFATMQRLHRELPWFVAQPLTVHADVARDDLGEILGRHGFALHDLDGDRIASWSDLAHALEERFGAQRFPSDPRQKVPQLLAKASMAARGRAVLRWRNAAATVAADPALLLQFASICTGTSMPVFVDLPALPARVEPDAPTALHRGDTGEAEPDVAALAGAPDSSWWKPRPGEMTR